MGGGMSGGETWRSLAELTANRLRLIQADLADEPAESRRAHLNDEVKAALEKVPLAERNDFLDAVEERFPAWEGGRVVSGAGGGTMLSPTDMAEFNDPGFLIRQLVKVAASMSEEQRREAAERLAAAGIAPAGAGEIPAESLARAKAAMQIPADGNADGGRMLEAGALLAEQVILLDTLVWKIWRQIAPDSSHRGRGSVGPTLASYVQGGGETGRGQVAEELERFRQLTAAVLSSVGKVGGTVYTMMARMSPHNIESISKTEKKWNESVEIAAWKKYKELAGKLDQATVESEVMRAVSQTVEEIVRPRGR
ncbi:MAG: hypothetical protein H6810_13025 [Phycisphaeraceae bacterium]|nr:MAG: hypothetical protein H6810_13025 [Phycisphaeraceae bacterium]